MTNLKSPYDWYAEKPADWGWYLCRNGWVKQIPYDEGFKLLNHATTIIGQVDEWTVLFEEYYETQVKVELDNGDTLYLITDTWEDEPEWLGKDDEWADPDEDPVVKFALPSCLARR